jgi:hypothetical protein
MSTKTLIWIGLTIGSTAGSYIASLFDPNIFSMWGVIASAIGGLIGIWLGYKMGNGDL